MGKYISSCNVIMFPYIKALIFQDLAFFYVAENPATFCLSHSSHFEETTTKHFVRLKAGTHIFLDSLKPPWKNNNKQLFSS